MIKFYMPHDEMGQLDWSRYRITGGIDWNIRDQNWVQAKCFRLDDDAFLVFKLDLLIWYRVNYD